MEEFFADLDGLWITFEFDEILNFVFQNFKFLKLKPLRQIVAYFDWGLDRFLHYFIQLNKWS